MIGTWWVVDKTAHLLHPGSAHPRIRDDANPRGRDGRVHSWCSMDIPRGSSEAAYETRCKRCTDALMRYEQSALAPLPDVVLETVTVSVVRPTDSPTSAAEAIEMMLRRKRTWSRVNVRSQEIGAVE